MFYEIGKKHGLPHDPWKSCVVPRPIGWISTLSAAGIPNLAPFSFFNGCGDFPPHVMYAPLGRHQDGGFKDSLVNVEATKEFVASMCTSDLREPMNVTSRHVARGVNEFALAGLTPEPSTLVKPPRVKEAPIHIECRYVKTVELPSWSEKYPNFVVFGQIVGIHIRDDVMTNGMVDILKVKPLARLGYLDYTVVDNVFTMPFPDEGTIDRAAAKPRVAEPAE